MKQLVLVVLLTYSSGVFADVERVTYRGQGEWKDNTGNSSEYQVIKHKEKLDNGQIKITTSIDTNNRTMTWVEIITLNSGDEGSFSVDNERGQHIGQGYCFGELLGKICHMDTYRNGNRIEQTIRKGLFRLRTIGSMTNTITGKVLRWKDYLTQSNDH